MFIGVCEHCHYLGAEGDGFVCRRHAPQREAVLELPDGRTLMLGRWPYVSLDDTCGEITSRVDLPK